MSVAIKIGLIVIAILAVCALLSPVLSTFGGFAADISGIFGTLINSVAPYLLMGRKLLNAVLGYPVLVDFSLWTAFILPVLLLGVQWVIGLYHRLSK